MGTGKRRGIIKINILFLSIVILVCFFFAARISSFFFREEIYCLSQTLSLLFCVYLLLLLFGVDFAKKQPDAIAKAKERQSGGIDDDDEKCTPEKRRAREEWECRRNEKVVYNSQLSDIFILQLSASWGVGESCGWSKKKTTSQQDIVKKWN